jgi:hypothetical protein
MQHKKRFTAITAAGGAAALLLTGGSAVASAHAVHPARVTGREVISHSGKETYAQATKPNQKIPVRLRGVVSTRGRIDLGGSANPRPINTRVGRLMLLIKSMKVTNKVLDKATCHLQTTVTGKVFARGMRSTGRFAGAKGHGTLVVKFRLFFPKVNGKCNFHGPGLNRGGHVSFLTVISALTVPGGQGVAR